MDMKRADRYSNRVRSIVILESVLESSSDNIHCLVPVFFRHILFSTLERNCDQDQIERYVVPGLIYACYAAGEYKLTYKTLSFKR